MSDAEVDKSKRTWLIASGCAGAVGTVCTAVPFVESFEPSEQAKAAGAPVEVDISQIKPGTKITVAWRGQPVWIMHRTPEELAGLPKNKPEHLVMVGICTHLGCSPSDRFTPGPGQPGLPNDWRGGWLCPCHGSTYDLAGRVYKNKPAPYNMPVPPYTYLSDTRVLIGEHHKPKA